MVNEKQEKYFLQLWNKRGSVPVQKVVLADLAVLARSYGKLIKRCQTSTETSGGWGIVTTGKRQLCKSVET